LDNAKHGSAYGVTVEKASIDHSTVIERKDKVVKTLVSGISSALKANKVTVVNGSGVICGKVENNFRVVVDNIEYLGKNLLISTGSVPVIPPIKGVKESVDAGFVITNREILSLGKVPERLVIIGGGVIGLEMASYYNSVGSVVTIIEMLGNIGGMIDSDISEILLKNYKKKGVEFCLNSKVVEVKNNAVLYEKDGKTYEANADIVLMSVGRRPFTQSLGLETIGVEIERGAVKTDKYCKTNIPNVYAAGDVNGVSMLAHTAYREAEVAVNNILGNKDIMSYKAIPGVIYTNPEVACIGETEQSAKAKGIDVESVSISMKYSGRYVAENAEGDGICKVIINKKYRNVIGLHLICNYASEIIWGASQIVESELPLKSLKKLVFPHPSVAEIIKEAINTINN